MRRDSGCERDGVGERGREGGRRGDSRYEREGGVRERVW